MEISDSSYDMMSTSLTGPPLPIYRALVMPQPYTNTDEIELWDNYEPIDFWGLSKAIVAGTKGAVMKMGIPGILAYNAAKATLGGTILYDTLGKASMEAINLNLSTEQEIIGRVAAATAILLTSMTFWGAVAASMRIKTGQKEDVDAQPEVST